MDHRPLQSADSERKDITVVAVGHLVADALRAAGKLEDRGISIEIFDPRSLLPLDKDLLKESVKKTGRVVVLDDSNRTCGFAAEVLAFPSEECFPYLKTPLKRVTRADVPVPFSPPMESYVLPDEEKLVSTVLEIFQLSIKH